MASGNEEGANSYWLPGGFTMGAIPEAIVDPIPKERACVKFFLGTGNEELGTSRD